MIYLSNSPFVSLSVSLSVCVFQWGKELLNVFKFSARVP